LFIEELVSLLRVYRLSDLESLNECLDPQALLLPEGTGRSFG
jgi:hypothetical protein